MVVGACQKFQLFRQIAWLLRNNGTLSKFRYQTCISYLVLPDYEKANFKLTTRATLNI